MLHETFFPFQSAKMFLILIKNISQQICVMSNALLFKAFSWDDDVHHLLLQIKVSKWPMIERIAVERFMAGRIVETKGKQETATRCKSREISSTNRYITIT